ncbi:hypothetical protein SLEP1_g13311 [Rubroshorea leprosula]|uniref:Uncharacterized protein n=1 Tax=Rubroshorea leprosula TaxID=152421 RepID=A0AAV5INF1_9ROSI|nr:hypothetical protein SLEP1_g13311 [Rubroshorea leprosula]
MDIDGTIDNDGLQHSNFKDIITVNFACFSSFSSPCSSRRPPAKPTASHEEKPVGSLKFLLLSCPRTRFRSLKSSPLLQKISRSALLCLHHRLLCGWVISGHFFDCVNFPLHFPPALPQLQLRFCLLNSDM